jgi:hypothetical protein
VRLLDLPGALLLLLGDEAAVGRALGHVVDDLVLRAEHALLVRLDVRVPLLPLSVQTRRDGRAQVVVGHLCCCCCSRK